LILSFQSFNSEASADIITISDEISCNSIGGIWNDLVSTCIVEILGIDLLDILTISEFITLRYDQLIVAGDLFVEGNLYSGNGSQGILEDGGTIRVLSSGIWFQSNQCFDGNSCVEEGDNDFTIFEGGQVLLQDGGKIFQGSFCFDPAGCPHTGDNTLLVQGGKITGTNLSEIFQGNSCSGTNGAECADFANNKLRLFASADLTMEDSLYTQSSICDGVVCDDNHNNIFESDSSLTVFSGCGLYGITKWENSSHISRGICENFGFIDLLGSFTIESTASFDNHDSGTFNNLGDDTVINFGLFNNIGLLNNTGVFDNRCAGTVINTGTIIGNPIINTGLPPDSGDWIITRDCTLDSSASVAGDFIIDENSIFTIPSGMTLTIEPGKKLLVKNGSGLLIKSGGSLQVNS